MSASEAARLEDRAGKPWAGSVEDEQQPKPPLRVGLALAIGVVLWLGPYLGVAAVLLPAKIAEIAPHDKAGVLAVVSTSALIVATLANIVIGALSDLTRSRWGRRAPWLVGGSIASAAMLLVVASVHTVAGLIVTWCVYQLFLNAIVAPLIAVIADRAAPRHRGTISSVYALGYSIGLYGGQVVGAQFLGVLGVGFGIMAVLTAISGPVAAAIMREGSSLAMPKRKFDRRLLLDNFSLPRHGARDYYLALFGKFLVVSATFAVSGYQLYILTDYMHLGTAETAHYVSTISLVLVVTALVMSIVVGPIADRLQRRKVMVLISSLLIALGVLAPVIAPKPWTMIVYAAIAGIGIGAFNAVDQALNVAVLPSHDTAAKDLGVLNLANTGGQVIGPVIAALAISEIGYRAVFPAVAALAVIGFVLIALIRSVR